MTYEPTAITELRIYANTTFTAEMAAVTTVRCAQIITSPELPTLTSFSLNLDTGLLTLEFSKVIIHHLLHNVAVVKYASHRFAYIGHGHFEP